MDKRGDVEQQRGKSMGPPARHSGPPSSVVAQSVMAMNRVLYYTIAALLAGMSLLAFLQIVVRLSHSVLDSGLSVPWSEELSRSLMVWLIFLGAAYACRAGQMIALTFVADAVPAYLRRAVDGVSALLCIGFYLLLVQLGIKAVSFGWLELSPVMHFPKAYVYLAMPVGAVIMVINTVALLAERGMFRKHYSRVEDADAAAEGTFE